MRNKEYVYSFRYISLIIVVIRRKMFFVLPVKCPLLWTDQNENYTACGPCTVNQVCVVQGRSL